MRLRASRSFLLAVLGAAALALQPVAAQSPGDAELMEMNSRINEFYQAGKYNEAIPLAEQYAVAVASDDRKYAAALNNWALLLQATNRFSDAEHMMRQALFLAEKNYGPEHPKVAICLNNLAELLQVTSRLSEAEPLRRRALAIDEKSFGRSHPNVVRDLKNLAALLVATNRRSEAERLMRSVGHR